MQALRLLPGLLRSSYSLTRPRQPRDSASAAPSYRTSCTSMGIALSPRGTRLSSGTGSGYGQGEARGNKMPRQGPTRGMAFWRCS